MPITASKAQKIVSLLQAKVKAGTLDEATAKHLTVVAMEEVAPAEDTASPGDEVDTVEPAAPAAPAAAPAPLQHSTIDPKTRILSLLTDFEKQASQMFDKMKARIDEVIKGTEGAAFPLGSFDVKASDNVSKLVIENSDLKKGSVDLSFSFDRKWVVDGVNAPAAVAAKLEDSCHVPLRKDLLTLAADVEDYAASELGWSRKGLPLKVFAQIAKEASKENDLRVSEIVSAAPFEKAAHEWRCWSIAAQVYLLGTDFSTNKSFNRILQDVEAAHEVSEED